MSFCHLFTFSLITDTLFKPHLKSIAAIVPCELFSIYSNIFLIHVATAGTGFLDPPRNYDWLVGVRSRETVFINMRKTLFCVLFKFTAFLRFLIFVYFYNIFVFKYEKMAYTYIIKQQITIAFSFVMQIYGYLPGRRALPLDCYSFPVPLTVGGWVGLSGWLRIRV